MHVSVRSPSLRANATQISFASMLDSLLISDLFAHLQPCAYDRPLKTLITTCPQGWLCVYIFRPCHFDSVFACDAYYFVPSKTEFVLLIFCSKNTKEMISNHTISFPCYSKLRREVHVIPDYFVDYFLLGYGVVIIVLGCCYSYKRIRLVLSCNIFQIQ